jgi:DNA-binding CsgD family transcriptional regulator
LAGVSKVSDDSVTRGSTSSFAPPPMPRAKAGSDSLTDSELRVVNLIAQGATNRDVAAQLHLSLHPAKYRVHNAFAKLGINSRAQLAQFVRGSYHPIHTALNTNPRSMVLRCSRGDRSTRQLITHSPKRRTRPTHRLRRRAHEETI